VLNRPSTYLEELRKLDRLIQNSVFPILVANLVGEELKPFVFVMLICLNESQSSIIANDRRKLRNPEAEINDTK
jgi:hypothetical protein